ncbi:MAG TPA: HEAT repeat domain-containing protein [Phycisphaerae bacterium]|nr:HEAT repeat domain-containing protein [Phycisphaerae bacterium]
MSETSRFWPYIRAIGKALTIPTTKIGLSILTDIQDQLSADEFQRYVKEALNAIHGDTAATLARLEKEDIKVSAQGLTEAARQLAEACYLKRTADEFLYSDFKGIEQLEKLVPLKLDELFVNLRVKPERSAAERHEREGELLGRLAKAERAERDDVEQRLAELDVEKIRGIKAEAEPRAIDRVLAKPGGVVLLGGPGSGKTTLIKRLARSVALGPEVAKERYPDLPECFPIVVPVAVFDDQRDARGLFEYVQRRLDEIGGQPLVQVFTDRWAAGQCLLLLDGLDEVADTGRRIGCAKAVEEVLKTLGGNRVLVSSRPVGYSITRLCVPAEHVLVQPFERGDIETFVQQWHLAYDRAVHADRPDPQQAETDARDLIREIQANDRVESLATNPLMLTIIALIKQQQVTLPERRVELYEVALNTLIRSWNKARSLSGRPIGEALSAEETKKVWSRVAFWMHKTKGTGTCHRQQLQERLVEVLTEIGKDEIEAEKTAESYIDTAAERAGLLEERGANVFAFMHQTFQEYLAARHLAMPHRKVIERVLEIAPDPRWHEVIRLTAGYIGVIQEDDEMVTELVTAIANDDGNPLEPYLCTSLRLAASCIADGVRVRQRAADNVVSEVCRRLGAISYGPSVHALCDALQGMRNHVPEEPAVVALRGLIETSGCEPCREAVRMLSRVSDRNPSVLACLRTVFATNEDPDIRGLAALGIWRSGERRNSAVVDAIAYGLDQTFCTLDPPRDPELMRQIGVLLRANDAAVRIQSLRALGKLSHRGEAVDDVIRLLEDENALVRIEAAVFLRENGHATRATVALLSVFEHEEEEGVRYRCGGLLRKGRPDNGAVQCMLEHLTSGNDLTRYIATEALAEWGFHLDHIHALTRLLEHDQSSVRRCAATVLRAWGYQQDVVSNLLALLKHAQWEIKCTAVALLGLWRCPETVVAGVRPLLEDQAIGVRCCASQTLCRWGHQRDAIPTILELLNSEDADVRCSTAQIFVDCRPEPRLIPELHRLLSDRNPHVCGVAAVALGSHGSRTECVETLMRLLYNNDPLVRLRAAWWLAEWGCTEKGATQVIELLTHDSGKVRSEAVGVLRRWKPAPEAVQDLPKVLKHADPYVRYAGAEVLRSWGPKSESLPLVIDLLGDESDQVRESAFASLEQWGPDIRAAPRLVTLAQEGNALARWRAVEVLEKWDGANGIAALLIPELVGNQSTPAVAYLERAGQGRREQPSTDVARLLARAIEPNEDDTERVKRLRGIVFQWVWQASQYGD